MPKTAPLQVGTDELLLAALTFAALEAQAENIRRIVEAGFESPAQAQAAVLELVHASLQRLQPELTLEAVKAGLDWPTAQDAAITVLQLSFPQQPPGESRAGSPSGMLTGSS